MKNQNHHTFMAGAIITAISCGIMFLMTFRKSYGDFFGIMALTSAVIAVVTFLYFDTFKLDDVRYPDSDNSNDSDDSDDKRAK